MFNNTVCINDLHRVLLNVTWTLVTINKKHKLQPIPGLMTFKIPLDIVTSQDVIDY